jgi:PhoD related phosphatase
MLHNNKVHYVPPNGTRTQPGISSDTKEDMMEIFQTEANGAAREMKRLMGRRNYVAFAAYDADAMAGHYGHAPEKAPHAGPNVSLAVDFMVQGEGGFTAPIKYGPVVIPKLDYGQ